MSMHSGRKHPGPVLHTLSMCRMTQAEIRIIRLPCFHTYKKCGNSALQTDASQGIFVRLMTLPATR